MWPAFAHSFLAFVALVAWDRRRAILLFLSFASFAGNLVALCASFGWDALSVSRSLYLHNILPLCHHILPQLWRRPCLFVLLNIILLTIVLKSRAEALAKEAHLPPVFPTKIHRIASLKACLHDFDVQGSGISNPYQKHEQTVGFKRHSLFTIEPLETDREAACQSGLFYHVEEEKIFSKTVTENPPLFSALLDQKAVPMPRCGLVEDTWVTVEAQVVFVKDSNVGGCPDEQSVLIDGVEDIIDEGLSTEEFNRKAEAYIQKVRKTWWLQRQDSFNRLCGLISGDSGSLR